MASRPAKLNSVSDDISLDYFRSQTLTKRSKERGYSYFVLGYIFGVKLYNVSENETDVRCFSYRSMRKSESPHTVNLTIREADRCFSSSHCTCQAGASGTCAHVVGLVHTLSHYKKMGLNEVPGDLSVTSLPQQWHKPRGSKIKPAPVVSMVMAKPTNPHKKKKPVMAKLSKQRIPQADSASIAALRSMTDTPLSYLLSDTAPQETLKLGPVQLGSSLTYHLDSYKETHETLTPSMPSCGTTTFPLPSHLPISEETSNMSATKITQEEAVDLENSTKRQSNDMKWFAERNNRITASQFHRIVKRQRLVTEKFVQNILTERQFSSVPTSYGKSNEESAKRTFTEKNSNVHVHNCGLVVNPKISFLGATPDGKVCEKGQTGILEIKCPYTARDMTLKEAAQTLQGFCLKEDQLNKLTVNQEHDHFIQIQGQLLISGAPFCYYVVHTRRDSFSEKILPHLQTQRNILQKLCTFYETYALPIILRNST